MYIRFNQKGKYHVYSIGTGVTVCGKKFDKEHSETQSISSEINHKQLCGNCERRMGGNF